MNPSEELNKNTRHVAGPEGDFREVNHGLAPKVEVSEKLAVTQNEAANARSAYAGASPGAPQPTWPRLGDEIVRPRKRNRPWA